MKQFCVSTRLKAIKKASIGFIGKLDFKIIGFYLRVNILKNFQFFFVFFSSQLVSLFHVN